MNAVNRSSFLFLTICLASCSSSQKEHTEKASSKNEDVAVSLIEESQKPIEETNSKIKMALEGIWASHEYKNLLFESNSVTFADNGVSFYTDIVFDGDETLHCNSPRHMEEDYRYLKPDSSVTDQQGNIAFRILKIESQLMVVSDSSNGEYSFYRVAEHADLKRIYSEVQKGTSAAKKEWLASKYEIQLNTLTFKAELMKIGEVKSDVQLKEVIPFSYLESDLIEFRFEDESELLYLIRTHSDTLISLEGIENILSSDDPIVPNGTAGYMKKI